MISEMKKLIPFLLSVLYAFISCSYAYPGMKATTSELHHIARNDIHARNSKELIGDLKTLKDTQLTQIGKDIKAILLGTASAISTTIDAGIPAGNLGSDACNKDLCCVWKWVSYDMTLVFNGTSGRCTKFARGAVRLGFHDAAVWSTSTSYGGADGSILLSDEMSRSDNDGLADIANQMKTWYNKYNQYGVSMADLIQMGANIATVVCPLGPRLRSFVGRKDNSKAGPTGLLPGVNDSADKLLSLFQAKTIDVHDLVALVGAHTTSQQHFVDKTRDGDPQDSTPGEWDVAFYGQTTASSVPPRILKFASDVKLSQDSRSKADWQNFVGQQNGWNVAYANAYTRLSLLGVNNINDLKECTKVLPPARTSFVSQDQAVLDLWLQGQFDQLNNLVDEAQMLTGLTGGTTLPGSTTCINGVCTSNP